MIFFQKIQKKPKSLIISVITEYKIGIHERSINIFLLEVQKFLHTTRVIVGFPIKKSTDIFLLFFTDEESHAKKRFHKLKHIENGHPGR
jgi:hypothetical protein